MLSSAEAEASQHGYMWNKIHKCNTYIVGYAFPTPGSVIAQYGNAGCRLQPKTKFLARIPTVTTKLITLMRSVSEN